MIAFFGKARTVAPLATASCRDGGRTSAERSFMAAAILHALGGCGEFVTRLGSRSSLRGTPVAAYATAHESGGSHDQDRRIKPEQPAAADRLYRAPAVRGAAAADLRPPRGPRRLARAPGPHDRRPGADPDCGALRGVPLGQRPVWPLAAR